MRRGLVLVMLIGLICLLGMTPALAQVGIATIYPTPQAYEEATGKTITKFSEAPELRVEVAAGEIPPLLERLPEDFVVVQPGEEIGQYGGTLVRAWLGPSDAWGPNKIVYDRLTTTSMVDGSVVPNAMKGWDVSEDSRVYTFYLRKGLKWSDGQLFSVDDLLYKLKDVYLNDEIYPVKPTWLLSGGEEAGLEKIDDYTLKISFAEPYLRFMEMYTIFAGYPIAKHYFSQFHASYTPTEELQKMVKDGGFENWVQLHASKQLTHYPARTPDAPVINAWMLVTDPTAVRTVMKRNPYYWKVDTEGNQLPYIDRIVNDLVSDREMINLRAATGEIDFQGRHIQMGNYSLFMENAEDGDYRIMQWKSPPQGAAVKIMPNISHKDPVLRKIILDVRFRQALSLAIDREEINEIVYLGLGEPRQASLPSGVPFYSEEWATTYADYEPEEANALLDEMGLTERDGDGFRLRPDGEVILMLVDIPFTGAMVDVMTLVKDYWEAIGIKTALKVEDRGLYTERTLANEDTVKIFAMGWAAAQLLSYPYITVPLKPVNSIFGTGYGRWYESGGKEGIEPPEEIKELQDLWDEIQENLDDQEEIDRLTKLIIENHTRNIWNIGTVGEMPQVFIVNNNLRNVPEQPGPYYDDPWHLQTAQFFFKQD